MLIIIIRNALNLTSSKHDKQHPNESINHKATYSEIPKIPSEHLAIVTLEHGRLYTSVPSSGIGRYASQPRETSRLTTTMLMEIMIQPQTHAKHIHG